ncbi:MAG: hypothetical protein U9R08_00925 [Nanoarchaeota archaeon]|nr:hypothetical protein [Nanoarchaeota archaeon]
MLQEQDRQKLDNIVKQMTTNKESQENIQFVVNDFKQKYSKKEIDKSVKGESLFEDIRLGLAKSEIGLVKGVGSLFGKLGAGIMAVPRSLGGEESFGEAYERGKRIGKKNVERIFGDRVFSEEALKREGAGQQIGGAVGDIATFLAPAGAITKGATAVSKVAGAGKTLSKTRGLLGRAGTEALGYGAVETARQGELNEEVATVGGIAGALPIVGAVAKPVISKIADTGGRILKSTAGVFSGKGTAVIDSILKNPVAALKGLRGETSLTSQAKDIQKGVKTLRSNAGKEYREAVDKLPVKFKKFKNGATQVISQEGKKTTITTKGILENLSKTLDDFKVTMDGGKLNTKYSPLDNIEAKRLDDVFDAINK